MTRLTLRHAALPAALVLSALAHTAHAQNVTFTTNTTVDATNSVTGQAFIGNATTSPTVTLVDGGFVTGRVTVNNSSILNLNAGSIIGTIVSANNSSTVNITGGVILGDSGFGVVAYDNSIINISGGNAGASQIGDYYARGNSTIHFSGTGLSDHLDATSFVAGYSQYALFGKLRDGTSLSGKYVYLQDGSTARFTINAVPEASSVISFGLLGLGSIGLLARRKRAV